MDLKNGNILIRQLEANPKAKELMLREFPMLSSQLIRLVRNMTLSQVLDLVKSFHVPQSKINRVLQQLKNYKSFAAICKASLRSSPITIICSHLHNL